MSNFKLIRTSFAVALIALAATIGFMVGTQKASVEVPASQAVVQAAYPDSDTAELVAAVASPAQALESVANGATVLMYGVVGLLAGFALALVASHPLALAVTVKSRREEAARNRTRRTYGYGSGTTYRI